MNTDNITYVRDFMRDVLPDEYYDQAHVGEHLHVTTKGEAYCGTPGCVLGWTVALLGNYRDLIERHGGIKWNYAQELLFGDTDAHSDTQAYKLFRMFPVGDYEPTVQDAAAALTHLLETGNVRWPDGKDRDA